MQYPYIRAFGVIIGEPRNYVSSQIAAARSLDAPFTTYAVLGDRPLTLTDLRLSGGVTSGGVTADKIREVARRFKSGEDE